MNTHLHGTVGSGHVPEPTESSIRLGNDVV